MTQDEAEKLLHVQAQMLDAVDGIMRSVKVIQAQIGVVNTLVAQAFNVEPALVETALTEHVESARGALTERELEALVKGE